MYIYVYAYVYIYVYAYVYIYVYASKKYICTYMYASKKLRQRRMLYKYTCIRTYMHTCMYMRTHIPQMHQMEERKEEPCVCVCVCIYIYIHTYIDITNAPNEREKIRTVHIYIYIHTYIDIATK